MKRTLKTSLAALLSVLILVLCCAPSLAAGKNGADAAGAAGGAGKLAFGPDGKFTILQITDAQDDMYPAHELIPFLKKSIELASPDLIVCTGDMVEDTRPCDFGVDDHPIWEGVKTADPEKTRANTEKAADFVFSVFEESGVPFAVALGNNDWKVGMDGDDWLRLLDKYEMNITADMSVGSGGVDYRLPVWSSDGKTTLFDLYCLDTGRHGISDESLEWFRTESAARKDADGKAVPSFVFQHIPVGECGRLFEKCKKSDPGAERYAFGYYRLIDGAQGYFQSAYMGSDSEEFSAWKESGSVIAAFFGHMHQDGYTGTYDGIELNLTYGCEFAKNGPYGVRVITLDENDVTDYENILYQYKNGEFTSETAKRSDLSFLERLGMTLDGMRYMTERFFKNIF